MLKSEHRLPKGIRLVVPKVIRTDLFLIKVARNNKEHCRIAIAVPKKIDKRAVVRNRIKRQISSCLEGKIKTLPALDMLFIVLKKIEDVETITICQEIEKILKNIPGS